MDIDRYNARIFGTCTLNLYWSLYVHVSHPYFKNFHGNDE